MIKTKELKGKENIMKVWELSVTNEHDWLWLSKKNRIKREVDWMQSFDGRSHREKWKPVIVERMEPEKKLLLGDYAAFITQAPAFSAEALKVLEPLIGDFVEALELVFDERMYFLINVINVLDVIDYKKSKYIKYPDSDRIMMFEKYVFRECKELERSHIFKIVDMPLAYIFVSDQFKHAVEEYELTGFAFELKWDSEGERA